MLDYFACEMVACGFSRASRPRIPMPRRS